MDRYIAGVPCWIDSSQPDPDAAASFYGALFGWEIEDVLPAGSDGKYLVGRIRGGDVAAISSQQEGAPPQPVWNTYIWVDSADDTAAKVRDAGGSVLSEPFDVMEAGRMAVFADPAGAVFCVWQPGKHRGATVVNEHGSLNFNDLHTPDPWAAASFYGAVFGWETLRLGSGTAWTLPGYGDFLETLDPGMRERMASVGAPAGFEDVVATLQPADAGPAFWGVTFAADDADAIAARAAELGATVVVAPHDAPWVRTTVIRDPQGATFTVNQFVIANKDIEAPAASSVGS